MASRGGTAATEAKRREEEERMKIINQWQLSSTRNNPRKKAPVWKYPYYFSSTHKDKLNEIYCMKCRYWVGGGLMTHVKQHHDRHHDADNDTTTTTGSSSDGGSGGPAGGCDKLQQLKMNQAYKYPKAVQARLTSKLAGFLIRDARPAALTVGEGFRELVHALNPRYVVPGLKKIREVTHAMCLAARDEVLDYIHPLKQKGPAALRGMVGCVSLDLWTDLTQVEYMGVLLHTIKETEGGYEQKEFCLACTEVDANHITAEVVQEHLEAALKNFGLPVKSIFRAVHDGDMKVIKAVRTAGLSSSLCFIHSLQRTIAVSLKGVDAVHAVLKRTKKAVTSARQSNVQAAYLREAQLAIGAPQRTLVQDNQTRWGSTHDMAERATEQRGAFPAAYALDDDRNPLASKKVFDPDKRLRPGDFSLLGEVVAVYNPFRKVTTELQSAGITASLVVPAYMGLLEGLDPTSDVVVEMPVAGTTYPATSVTKLVSELDASVKRIAAQAYTDMIKRFMLRRMLPLAVATCLDPRMKNLQAFGVPDEISKKAWAVIQQQTDRAITALKKGGRYAGEGRGEKRSADGDAKTGGSFMAALHAKARKHSNDMPVGALPALGAGVEPALDFTDVDLENGVEVASEITNYLRKELADMGPDKPDPLEVWWGFRKDCPALAIVAMHYLSIPASSSGVERLFSKTGLIKSKLRNRLLPKTLEELIFTRANWNDSLYHVRVKKDTGGADESKGGEAGGNGEDEEAEEDDEDEEAQWAELEGEIVGETDIEMRAGDEFGLEALMGIDFVQPDDDFWDEFGEGREVWLDEE